MTSKYHAIPTEVEGIRFASRMEARRYQELRLLEGAGEIRDLEVQPRYPLRVNGRLICTYVADFRYWDVREGRQIVEDAKGVRTSTYKIKAKLMAACHGITVREVQA